MEASPELLERARTGDKSAMETVLASVAPSVHRFAMRMCRNAADADDVLQDALLAVATHLKEFEGRSSLSSWAFMLTRTACSRRRRGFENKPKQSDEALAHEHDDAPGPEEHTASRELGAKVEVALGALPDDYREVLLLRDAEGLTAPEAAGVLGVSVDAVKSRLHRARAALRDALRPVLEPGAGPTRHAGCPDVVLALSKKLEDDLDANACAEMEKHVSTCPSCGRTCDALRDALRACKESEGPALTPEIEARVRGAVSAWVNASR